MYLFEGVSICFIDVFKEGSGHLQGGDFVCIRLTEWHQHVQLITVQTDPLPVQKIGMHIVDFFTIPIPLNDTDTRPIHIVILSCCIRETLKRFMI